MAVAKATAISSFVAIFLPVADTFTDF